MTAATILPHLPDKSTEQAALERGLKGYPPAAAHTYMMGIYCRSSSPPQGV